LDESKNKIVIYDSKPIREKNYTVRGLQVMLDSDLADFYNVETRKPN